MREQNAISGWDRTVLWIVVTILIAGWWGVFGALFHWKTDAWLLWLATLNIVLTLRWFAARREKHSPQFRYTFAVVARITAAWFPAAFASLVPILFVSGPISTIAASTHVHHLSGRSASSVWTIHALVVSGGVAVTALLALFLKRHKLLLAAQNP